MNQMVNQPMTLQVTPSLPQRVHVMHRATKAGISTGAARVLRYALEGAEVEDGHAMAIVTCAELAASLGLTPRQIQRYAKELREIDAPWLGVTGGRQGYCVTVIPDSKRHEPVKTPDSKRQTTTVNDIEGDQTPTLDDISPTVNDIDACGPPTVNDISTTLDDSKRHGTEGATGGRGRSMTTTKVVVLEQQPARAPKPALADTRTHEAAAAQSPEVEEADPIESALDECMVELGQSLSSPMRRQSLRNLRGLDLQADEALEYIDWVVGTWAEESQTRHLPTLRDMLRDRHARWVRDREASQDRASLGSKPAKRLRQHTDPDEATKRVMAEMKAKRLAAMGVKS